jgi:hypothetical protein
VAADWINLVDVSGLDIFRSKLDFFMVSRGLQSRDR